MKNVLITESAFHPRLQYYKCQGTSSFEFIVYNSKFLYFNYCEVIDNFTESWVKLVSKFRLSTTPKLHITSGRGGLWGPAPYMSS